MRYALLFTLLVVGCGPYDSASSLSTSNLDSARNAQSDTKSIEELAEELLTLRTDPPPQEWKLEEINRAIPATYRDRSGEIHILAWAKFQDKSDQDVSERTHLLVLKKLNYRRKHSHRFASSDDLDRYILVHVICDSVDENFWRTPIEPSLEGLVCQGRYPAECYCQNLRELPTDFQVAKFLEASRWGCRPRDPSSSFIVVAVAADGSVDSRDSAAVAKPVEYVSSLVAGGVDPEVWTELFGRRVPITCFMPFAKNKVASGR